MARLTRDGHISYAKLYQLVKRLETACHPTIPRYMRSSAPPTKYSKVRLASVINSRYRPPSRQECGFCFCAVISKLWLRFHVPSDLLSANDPTAAITSSAFGFSFPPLRLCVKILLKYVYAFELARQKFLGCYGMRVYELIEKLRRSQ